MNLNLKILQIHISKEMFWLRVLGCGLHGKNTSIHHLTFSERLGYEKNIRIGNWSFKYLKR
jgi:hypothetical protein